ncbi:glia maturation factor beta-like isoform X3 [Patiria miniata]|uniref:ADF-H domain-containing protein n=1 Tax=Patiria miniata TaxID=46514 RepID=A0A914B9R9_PATMI|nr:glia maturation factor beta-like isoform X3 [Patiria miniata]
MQAGRNRHRKNAKKTSMTKTIFASLYSQNLISLVCAQNIKVCDLGEGVADKLEKIRLRKEKTNFALIFKIKDEVIVLEDELENMSVDELQAELPTSQPRYVVLSYCYKHNDGRTSYPLLFIFLSPSGCKPEQQMMYAGCKLNFVKASGLTKVNEIRNVEELTEEYIQEKLSFYH